MEGVNTLMPTLLKVGAQEADARDKAHQLSVRADAVEAQTRRQAESAARQAREDVRDARESAQEQSSAARVAAADSGLDLSGSTLLSLQGLENEGQRKIGELSHDSALRIRGIVDTGEEQAQSIRLAGRNILRAQERQSLLQLYPAVFSLASGAVGGKKS